MYIVTKKFGSVYTICDTCDMISEDITRDKLLEILEGGVFVWGASKQSVEFETPINVVLRMKDKEIRDYDGYLFNDFSNDLDPFYYQVMTFSNTNGDLCDYNVFEFVCKTLREINKGMYDISVLDKSLPVGYRVIDCCCNWLSVTDNTDFAFSSDFYTCLYIYLVEKKSIDGIREINLDRLISTTDKIYFGNDVLNEFYRASYDFYTEEGKDDIGVAYNPDDLTVDSLCADWDSLNEIFGVNNLLFLEDSYIPLYNVSKVIRHVNQSSIIKPWFLEFSNPLDFVNNTIVFADGRVVEDINVIASLCNVIDLPESKKLAMKNWVEMNIVKMELADKSTSKLKSLVENNFVIQSDIEDKKVKGFSLGGIRNYYEDKVRVADKGSFELITDGVMLNENEAFFNSIWIVRYSGLGSAAYSFFKNTLDIGTMEKVQGYSCLSSNKEHNTFHQVLDKAMIAGICYHKDMILPLCFSRYNYDEDTGLDVRIICLVSDKSDTWGMTGYGIFEVPLIFFGGKVVEYEDCFKVYTLCHTLAIEKKLMYNLCGEIDILSAVDDLFTTSKKLNRELLIRTKRSMKKTLKEVMLND